MLKTIHYCLLSLILLAFTFPQEPAAKPLIEIQIETTEGVGRESKPIANIEFVVLPKHEGPFVEPLVSGVTDERGIAVVRVPAALPDGKRPEVIVRVDQEGMQQLSMVPWKKKGTEDASRGFVARLRVTPGRTLWFQAVDKDDKPVAACVSWRSSSGAEGRRPSFLSADIRFGAGWLQVNLDREEKVDVWAWANGVGGGTAFWMQGDEDTTSAPSLKLVGDGILRGRVLSSSERPLVGIPLFLRWKGFEMKPGLRSGLPRAKLGESLTVSGLRFGQCTTDGEGRFELGGLEPGEYEILCAERSTSWAKWNVIGTSLVSSSGEPIVLRHDRATIEVLLQNAQGKPWAGPHGEQKGTIFGRRGRACDFLDWPDEPQLVVRELGDGDIMGLLSWYRSLALWAPSNTLFSEVKADSLYAVQVIGGSFLGDVHLVSTPKDPGASILEVVAGPECALGTLKVVPMRRGSKYSSIGSPEMNLWVADFETGLPLLSWQRYRDMPFQFSMPPGKYRVVLEGKASMDSHHGILMTPRRYGRTEAVVIVEAGGDHSVNLDLAHGGHLEIKVEAEPNATDLEALQKKYPQTPSDAEWLLDHSRTASIQIRRRHFISEFVTFSGFSMEHTSSAGTHLLRAWPFGEQHKSEMLPSGTYELIATTPGGRKLVQTIEIKEDQTLDLTLKFPSD